MLGVAGRPIETIVDHGPAMVLPPRLRAHVVEPLHRAQRPPSRVRMTRIKGGTLVADVPMSTNGPQNPEDCLAHAQGRGS
jgi:hypothetical protein